MQQYIVKNARIYTMASPMSRAEAMLVENGKIKKVGSYEDVLGAAGSCCPELDLLGKTIVPGFNDSHLHFLKGGQSSSYLDLAGATSVEEIIQRGRDFIQQQQIPEGKWVLGRGWDQMFFDVPEMPTSSDLDKISTVHPIAFSRSCEHAISINTAALQLAQITTSTPQPKGGEWCQGSQGNPNGILKDTARDLVYNLMKEPDKEEIKAYIIKACELALANGVTSVQTDDIWSIGSKNYNKVLTAYQELEQEGKLQVRIYQQCVLEGKDRLKQFLADGWKTGQGTHLFKIGPFKLFSDGAIGVRSAYLFEPYTDMPGHVGMLSFPEEEMLEIMELAANHGMQLTAHAIGDKAADTCIRAYAAASKVKKEDRSSIIHAHVLNPGICKKMVENHVVMIGDPVALVDDIPMYTERLGAQREMDSYPYRSFLDLGGLLALATDWPISPLCPMRNIYSAVERRMINGQPEGGWNPDEKITVEEAVYAYTVGAAYCSFEENIKGSLAEGKLADFVVLSKDIFSIEPQEILTTKVEQTYLGGQLVYQAAK